MPTGASAKMSQSIASDRISESTIARIAGNLLSGDHQTLHRRDWHKKSAEDAVALARAIAEEVQRTRPEVSHE